MVAMSDHKWRAARELQGSSIFPSLTFPHLITARKRIDRVHVCSANMIVSNAKRANLSAARKERAKLPITDDGYRISEFLNDPFGIQSTLNTSTMLNYQMLDSRTYRCFMPKLKLLSFEAAPVLDLRVTPTDKDCTVELLSCKFQGSDVVERQNSCFSAFMINHMTWDMTDSDPFLEADLKLNLTLEIYTMPFALLPISAVEVPGNLMMQALVDRLVPLFLEQLLNDYDKWARQQCHQIVS